MLNNWGYQLRRKPVPSPKRSDDAPTRSHWVECAQGRRGASSCCVKKNKVSPAKTQIHIAIHFENYKVTKRKLHRGEVIKYWVTFVTNIYHTSKFTLGPRQMGFGCSDSLGLEPRWMAEVSVWAADTSSLPRLAVLV